MKILDEQYKEDITNRIIKALEKGTAPWQRPWSTNLPKNAVTNKDYRGINSIILAIKGNELSEDQEEDRDQRWATQKQAESQGWSIKSGAEPTKIYVLIIPKKTKIHSDLLNRDVVVGGKKSAFTKVFEVYHASQIKGIPSFIKCFRQQIISNEIIDKIIFNASARIFEGGPKACYLPQSDLIKIPYKRYFDDTESYYSTLLHELVHWTGHSSRLKRFFDCNKDSEAYAREELVAEIASMMLTYEAGITLTQKHFDNHAAYVASWISLLKSDNNAIFKATQDAQKAVNFILAFQDDEQEKISA